jgi:hypothetical protein
VRLNDLVMMKSPPVEMFIAPAEICFSIPFTSSMQAGKFLKRDCQLVNAMPDFPNTLHDGIRTAYS